MDATQILAFNLTLLAAMASPGPALLFMLRNTLAGGLAAGIATGIGLGIAAAAWTGVALLGLDIVFRLFPWMFVAVRTAGALYLLWLAIGIWRSARQPIGDSPQSRGTALRGGLLVNLGNPKSVLFASAVLVVIFPAGLPIWQKAVIVSNHLAVEILVYAVFALALSRPVARDAYLGIKHLADRAAALVLGGLGLRLLLGR